MIAGVELKPLRRIVDERGYLMECLGVLPRYSQSLALPPAAIRLLLLPRREPEGGAV